MNDERLAASPATGEVVSDEAPAIDKLRQLVTRLRAPDGCPWDREQTLPDLRAYLLEEAHEVADAIDRGAWPDLAEELGDLLFQAVFVARLGEEAGELSLASVIDGIHAKMVARHPHVFGDEKLADSTAVRAAWERRKANANETERSLLAGVPTSLPALLAAYRMTQKAAGVGFDWPDHQGVLAKIDEELAELKAAMAPQSQDQPEDREAIREEIGDLLFSLVNLARKLGLDPEAALAQTNLKFRHRFAHVEAGLRQQGIALGQATLEEMDQLWEEAKAKAGD